MFELKELTMNFGAIAQKLIDSRLADIQTQTEQGELTEGLYLTYLLSSDKITRSEIYISVTELLLGGVDTVITTSDTLSQDNLSHIQRVPPY